MNWDMLLQRAPELEIHETTDGFLVYQRDRDRLHTLNLSALLVLEACDCTLRAGELPELIGAAFRLADPPTDDVAACVTNLLREGLLVTAGTTAREATEPAPASETGYKP